MANNQQQIEELKQKHQQEIYALKSQLIDLNSTLMKLQKAKSRQQTSVGIINLDDYEIVILFGVAAFAIFYQTTDKKTGNCVLLTESL